MKRVIVFANGVMDNPSETVSRWVRPGDWVVAANGGTRHALAAGLVPDHVIGDLDSLPNQFRARLAARGTTFHTHPPAKDATDLELALLWVVRNQESTVKNQELRVENRESGITYHGLCIVVLGASGGRPDQALANVLLLALPQLEGTDVVIAEGRWTIRCLRSGKIHHLHGQPGDSISLIPLGGSTEGVTTTGLTYALTNETLHFGRARGVSNVFEEGLATVTIRHGMLWCFHEQAST